MRRREFTVLLGCAGIAWPLAAFAQQRVRRLGVIVALAERDSEAKARVAAFREAIQELGWIEGRNLHMEIRYAAGNPDRARALAKELVAAAPDVILAHSTMAVTALQRETRSIPIVFVQVIDPLNSGLIASMARPGGNITGFTTYEYGIASKWLELLKEIAPRTVRVAALRDPTVAPSLGQLETIQAAAPSFGVEIVPLVARNGAEIESVLNSFAQGPGHGLIVLPGPLGIDQRDLIISLAARHRLPALYWLRFLAVGGGLMAYGVDNLDLWRRAASYVNRVFNGEKPADLPVMQPTKFELVINLKTARALDLTVPRRLLVSANEVIE